MKYFCKKYHRICAALILLCAYKPCVSLYDYACDDHEVYKSYVTAQKRDRNGEKIELYPSLNGHSGSAPNFYPITTNNTYICINGPAYLYYEKTSSLGVVYERPKMEVYDHICDTYNVYPGQGATNKSISERLYAVLLMGDESNYYEYPALQLFTAPYYHRDINQYINATSLILFGDEPCFIKKGGHYIRIKAPTPPTAATPADEKKLYCKLGYQKMLKGNDAGKAEARQKAKQILQISGDHSISNGGCSYAGYSASIDVFETSLKAIENKVAQYNTRKNSIKLCDADCLKKFDELITKYEKIPSKKEKVEMQKKKAQAVDTLRKEIDVLLDTGKTKIPWDDIAKNIDELKKASLTAHNDRQKNLQNRAEIKKLQLILKREPYKFDIIKDQVIKLDDKITAYSQSAASTPQDIDSKWNNVVTKMEEAWKTLGELEFYFKEAHEKTPRELDDIKKTDDLNKYLDKKEFSLSNEITFEAVLDGPEENCTEMSRSTKICDAAKPDKVESCNIFKSSLGYSRPEWGKEPDGDEWKNEVLDLVEEIFNIACFRTPKKFSRNVHRIFKFYLTSNSYFNRIPGSPPPPTPGSPPPPTPGSPPPPTPGSPPPPTPGSPPPQTPGSPPPQTPGSPPPQTPGSPPPQTPGSPTGGRQSRQVNTNPGQGTPQNNGASSSPVQQADKKERPFWKHIRKALRECRDKRQMLFIAEKRDSLTGWTLKVNNEGPPKEIIHHAEQADLEYTFNYVIEWQFQIFATVLGMCMPAYERKIPLISSRFYSMYTEDFIIPLRNTWVDSKDNKVFFWILGEFKFGETDKWVRNCMEASFLQTKLEYRPPRCVLVNNNQELNYYIAGSFPYGHKGRYAAVG